MPSDTIQSSSSNDDRVERLAAAILHHAGGMERFRTEVPKLFRKAIDEVIDCQRSGRFTLSETEKIEKTYLGTKIEILLRHHLRMVKGHTLDLFVEDFEADIRNTTGSNWTIPARAVGHPCALIKTEERAALCSFGLVLIKEDILNLRRRTISRSGFEKIHWMLWNEKYPPNPWEFIDPSVRNFQRRQISRQLAMGQARDEDALKMIRRNGGARDLLAPLGIAILWGKADRDLIRQLNLPHCEDDEFISHKARDTQEEQLLRRAGHID